MQLDLRLFVPIKGFPDYVVGRNGSIYSVQHGRKLNPYVNPKLTTPYCFVSLYNKRTRERKNALVHRLVAEAFLEDFSNDKVVIHKDGDTLNNRPENLICFDSKKASADYKIYTLGSQYGPMRRHPPIYNHETGRVYWSYSQAAEDLDVYASGVCRCCQGIQEHVHNLHFSYI